MLAFSAALMAIVATATTEPTIEPTAELTIEEQEALYHKLTGPYCDENAYTDPLCVHRA